MTPSSPSAPEHAPSVHRQHDVAVLVLHLGLRLDEADAGAGSPSAVPRARCSRHAGCRQGRPACASAGCRCRATRGSPIQQVAFAEHAHRHRAGVPSARREAAEQRGLGGCVVQVERLRVVGRREREHFLARDAIGAEGAHRADRKVFPEVTRCGAVYRPSGRSRHGLRFGLPRIPNDRRAAPLSSSGLRRAGRGRSAACRSSRPSPSRRAGRSCSP